MPLGSALATRSEIQQVCARSIANLQMQKDEDSCLALILMFSAELDNFRTRSSKSWTPATEFQFLGAKLFILGWSFPYQTQPDVFTMGNDKSLTSRKLILHEAMRISLRMLHIFCEWKSLAGHAQDLIDSDDPLPPQIYLPKVDFFTFYYAIATLYLFLSHFPSPTPSDTDLIYNQIRAAHTLLTRCSLKDEKHEWARMAFNVEMVGKWHASGRRLPPEAVIRNRMGASLFYDGMQKIAVLKAEKGGRSYGSDLTQPLPDREKQRWRKPSLTIEAIDHGGVDPAGTAGMTEPIPMALGMQEGPLDQTGLWPGWDESIWGWDLSMANSTQFEIDSTNTHVWQNPAETRLFG